MVRKLEEHADEVVAAHLAVSDPMIRTALTPAADAWSSRPKETIETQPPVSDDPLEIASMTREQRDALKRELLRQHPELAERIAGIRAVE